MHRWALHVVLVEECRINVRSWPLVHRHLRWTSWRHVHALLWRVEVAGMHWRAISPIRAGTSRRHVHAHRSLIHVHWVHVRRSIRTHSVGSHWPRRSIIPVILETWWHLLVHAGAVGAVVHWRRATIARHSVHGVRHRILHHRIRTAHHRVWIHHSLARMSHVLWWHILHPHSHTHSHAWLLVVRLHRRRWPSLLLAFKLVESLLCWQCDNGILPVELLLGEVLHNDSHAVLGA